jgi:flagellar biosynthetic protein FlhB
MSDSKDEGQEKTEEPSSKRSDEFREEGQVAKSSETGAFVVVIAAAGAASVLGSRLGAQLVASMKGAFHYTLDHGVGNAGGWISSFAWPVMQTTLIFVCMIFAAVFVGNVLQTGFLFSWKAMAPKPAQINPVEGFKRVFSMQVVMQLIKNILKVIVISMIVWSELKVRIVELTVMSAWPILDSLKWCSRLIAVLTLKTAIFLGVLAAGDYLYQWYTMHKKMMMSRQEIKDESKEQQLPDNVRAKVRQVASERSKRVIQKEVPKADVIITNPTHYAIAIRYRRFQDPAPRVVAKGKELLAAQIRQVAKENNVPLYEFPELARAIYAKVRVGDLIPADLYESVARVLAFIYKMHKDRNVMRA